MNDGHGLGWVPEPRLRRAAGRVAAIARPVGALMLPQPGRTHDVGRDPWILNQGSDPSCTGHNGTQVIYGLTGDRTSPEMLWLFSLLEDGERLGRVERRGLPTSAMLRAARKHGACPYQEWNRHLADYEFGKLPPALARATAQRFNLTADVVYARGRAIAERLADGIMRGRPGGVVVEVDRAFDNAKGSTPIGPRSGPSRGLHIMTSWLTCMTATGKILTGCVNSWGKGHGDGGIVWLTEERVAEAPFAFVGREVS